MMFSNFFTKIIDTFIFFIDYLLCYQFGTKNMYLEGNFSPVEEIDQVATDLKYEGTLPSDLKGEYVRNGPNNVVEPDALYHWFDGDGMLHGVRLDGTSASYVNRTVRTTKSKVDIESKQSGKPLAQTIGDKRGVLGLSKLLFHSLSGELNRLLPDKLDVGTANTSLAFHDKKLLATHEGSYPYAMRILLDGELETIGAYHYDSKLTHQMTAHPKVDATTGEMMFFGYDLMPDIVGDFIKYSVVDSEGDLIHTMPIKVKNPIMMHDFAITEHYSLFMDFPFCFDGLSMIKGSLPFKFKPEEGSRIGVLPRHAQDDSEMVWFDVDPCMVFHTFNSWEEKDEEGNTIIVLVASRYSHITLEFTTPLQKGEDRSGYAYKWKLNINTGSVEEGFLLSNADNEKKLFVDFPVINTKLMGHRTRFGYAAIFLPPTLVIGVIKYDLISGKELGRIVYGEDTYGGEAVFCPRENQSGEDDGYLMTFTRDERNNKSYCVIMCAKTMNSIPICKIEMPQRVPYGFHGIFVTEAQLQSQYA